MAGIKLFAKGLLALSLLVAAYTPASATDWEGAYIGAHLGGSWVNADVDVPGAGFSYDTRHGGVSGGILAGFNLQHRRFVWGLETDLNLIGGDDSYERVDNGTTFVQTPRQHISATLRARVGLALDSTLLFATAGLAVGGAEIELNSSAAGASSEDRETLAGFTVGAGVERMLSHRFFVRGEYMYTGYGENEFFSDRPFGQDPQEATFSVHTVRAGVGLKF